ncbi:MAG: 3-deoxy-manno-octulosonate cytidylyltransferase [Dialister sp.]|nr:3-deoxy-manno-octulosonate cytidylyltransferase [Dialister sp.]
MKAVCIIPARYGSTRLPGKPLRMIGGKTLIHRVYEQASKARIPEAVIIATDHDAIKKEVEQFGGKAVMTAESHPTGTDRLAEVSAALPEYDIIVNVQGDEPMIDPKVIDQLAEMLMKDSTLAMGTVATPLAEDEYDDPSAVKVVVSRQGRALYFSRSLIPYPRHNFAMPPLKHVGIYAYRKEFLQEFASLSQTPLEKTESLEQLRALETGHAIGVIVTDTDDIGIDTEEDLKKANEYFERNHL